MRDDGLLESALARPEHLHAYNSASTLAELAAAYGFGIAKNHAFVDGNKRAAFLSLGLFLAINGHRLRATAVMMSVASGEMDEAALAAWVTRTSPSDSILTLLRKTTTIVESD